MRTHRQWKLAVMCVHLTLTVLRCCRYCSFVDNVSYIVNESIRPDLIVGRNKARRDAHVTDAFICGNVTCYVPQERNVSTSYVSRPMTIALDYTRRKTILAVSFLGSSALAWFRWYTRVKGKGYKSERKTVDSDYKIPRFASASRYTSEIFLYITWPIILH